MPTDIGQADTAFGFVDTNIGPREIYARNLTRADGETATFYYRYSENDPRGDQVRVSSSMRSDARSPTMIAGAFVLPDGIVGKTEASATRNPAIPWTRRRASTTDVAGSWPIMQVEVG